MGHADEYHAAMIAMLELIWGAGFMAPGGEGNVANLVKGLAVRDKRVLDIGCGIGGPAFVLAGTYRAYVVGTDLEPGLVDRARRRAEELGLDARTEFRVVKPGPLTFPDESFDVVLSSGAFTQIDDKRGMYEECRRVLRPGGALTTYDWMKCEGEYSEDMRYWFETEGLTYAMQTPDRHAELLREAGFSDVAIVDRSDWYRRRAQDEYAKIRSELYPRMLELMGRKHADHFVENWRALTVVCAKGEMLQVYCRARKPS
jgi:ubiquinone/menaquinone biosynthesis C-methylase UbiE